MVDQWTRLWVQSPDKAKFTGILYGLQESLTRPDRKRPADRYADNFKQGIRQLSHRISIFNIFIFKVYKFLFVPTQKIVDCQKSGFLCYIANCRKFAT